VHLVLAGLAASTLLLGGCGFDAPTLQQYTPAHGVNVDQGDLSVRNLLVVASPDGTGIVSASLLSDTNDRLTAVSGRPLTQGDVPGAALDVTLAAPVTLPANELVTLTSPEPLVRVSSPDLAPGHSAELQLTFSSGARASARVPVMGFDDPIYATVSPTPLATAAPVTTPPADAPVAPADTPTVAATP